MSTTLRERVQAVTRAVRTGSDQLSAAWVREILNTALDTCPDVIDEPVPDHDELDGDKLTLRQFLETWTTDMGGLRSNRHFNAFEVYECLTDALKLPDAHFETEPLQLTYVDHGPIQVQPPPPSDWATWSCMLCGHTVPVCEHQIDTVGLQVGEADPGPPTMRTPDVKGIGKRYTPKPIDWAGVRRRLLSIAVGLVAASIAVGLLMAMGGPGTVGAIGLVLFTSGISIGVAGGVTWLAHDALTKRGQSSKSDRYETYERAYSGYTQNEPPTDPKPKPRTSSQFPLPEGPADDWEGAGTYDRRAD